MKVGDRVRVKAPLMLFNHPQHRNQPFNVEGMEGTVTAVLKKTGKAGQLAPTIKL